MNSKRQSLYLLTIAIGLNFLPAPGFASSLAEPVTPFDGSNSNVCEPKSQAVLWQGLFSPIAEELIKHPIKITEVGVNHVFHIEQEFIIGADTSATIRITPAEISAGRMQDAVWHLRRQAIDADYQARWKKYYDALLSAQQSRADQLLQNADEYLALKLPFAPSEQTAYNAIIESQIIALKKIIIAMTALPQPLPGLDEIFSLQPKSDARLDPSQLFNYVDQFLGAVSPNRNSDNNKSARENPLSYGSTAGDFRWRISAGPFGSGISDGGLSGVVKPAVPPKNNPKSLDTIRTGPNSSSQ